MFRFKMNYSYKDFQRKYSETCICEGHPRDKHNMVLIPIWSFYPGSKIWKAYPWGPVNVVFLSRWSLYIGGL